MGMVWCWYVTYYRYLLVFNFFFDIVHYNFHILLILHLWAQLETLFLKFYLLPYSMSSIWSLGFAICFSLHPLFPPCLPMKSSKWVLAFPSTHNCFFSWDIYGVTHVDAWFTSSGTIPCRTFTFLNFLKSIVSGTTLFAPWISLPPFWICWLPPLAFDFLAVSAVAERDSHSRERKFNTII